MMKTTFKALSLGVAIAVGAGLANYAPPAAAQWTVFDPVNYVQNFLTQLRAVQSNINEVQQLAYQLQQYQNMLRNTESLTGGDWSGAVNAIDRLGRVLEHGQALAVSSRDFEELFRTRFPGYEAPDDYGESYRAWSETSRDSIYGAMRVANMQAQGIQNEQHAIQRLRAAASSTIGQKAAIDAANQVALAQVEQLQQLRELMMAQMQAEGAYMAAQEQKDAAQEALIERSLQRAPRVRSEPNPAVHDLRRRQSN